MNDDLISRQAAVDVIRPLQTYKLGEGDSLILIAKAEVQTELMMLPSAQHTCETCCYWGSRMILRDGSLGDCGNFEKNLSKDFYCAWWSQREREGEQDE